MARFTTRAICELKSKSGSSSHTGGSVQGRAALLYSMYRMVSIVCVLHEPITLQCTGQVIFKEKMMALTQLSPSA